MRTKKAVVKQSQSAQERAELIGALAELDRMAKLLASKAAQRRQSDLDPLYVLLMSLQHNTDVALVLATGLFANERTGRRKS
jgi:hypothetical protein